MLYTNLKLLKEQDACSSGLSTLIASLPKTHGEEELISLAHILESNGLGHAIWALRATTVDARKIAARMSIDFAFQVLSNFEKQFPEDKRPRIALENAKLFLDGKITLKEVESARESAWTAADSAWAAAEATAWAAAEAAAEAAAGAVARAVGVAARVTGAAGAARVTGATVAAWVAAAAAAAESENAKIFKKWVSKKY